MALYRRNEFSPEITYSTDLNDLLTEVSRYVDNIEDEDVCNDAQRAFSNFVVALSADDDIANSLDLDLLT